MEYTQDLFYNNIPYTKGKFCKKLGYLKKSLIMNSFLKNLKNPYFIWTGTGRIKSLEKMILDTKTKNKMRKNPDLECYFYLYEPICARIGDYNRSFYSEFNSKIELKNLVSDELESIRIFIKNNDIKKFRVFTSDYNIQLIQNNYPDLKLDCLDLFLREVSNVYKDTAKIENNIEHKFWCGNWRYTIHRHIVTSYLSSFDGIYTWNVKCSFDTLSQNDWFDFNLLKGESYHRYTQVKDGCDYLYRNVLSIDQDIKAVSIKDYQDVIIPGDNAPVWTDHFLHSYKKCFCAVINETRYAQPFGYFSEKTLTAINSRLPIIIAAPPHTLEYLKKFGFKTFDRWWDESYDKEQDHYKRILKIFDVIDYINSKSIDELKVIYNEMSDVLDHNINVIKNIPMNDEVL